MSQRINELNVNGKPAKFTPEEINTQKPLKTFLEE